MNIVTSGVRRGCVRCRRSRAADGNESPVTSSRNPIQVPARAGSTPNHCASFYTPVFTFLKVLRVLFLTFWWWAELLLAEPFISQAPGGFSHAAWARNRCQLVTNNTIKSVTTRADTPRVRKINGRAKGWSLVNCDLHNVWKTSGTSWMSIA